MPASSPLHSADSCSRVRTRRVATPSGGLVWRCARRHADPTRTQIGERGLHLATRPLLPQHDGTALILANDVERVLADIDADHGDRGIGCLRHGVLLVFGAPCQLRLLAGQEHGRTIPLTGIGGFPPTAHDGRYATQLITFGRVTRVPAPPVPFSVNMLA